MANQDPKQDRQDRNVEEPGDTGAPDIVGPTGEEMPLQTHDGLEPAQPERKAQPDDADERRRPRT
jgi:hypothetical protein